MPPVRKGRKGSIESALSKQQKTFAGIDEVGRGCLAGPVYAAIVVLAYERVRKLKKDERDLIRDSKTLTPLQRARIVPVIQAIADEWYISSASVAEIESLGILKANFLAMRRALNQCHTDIDTLLVDGNLQVPGYNGHQMTVVKGDSLCFSIAAASILAKEARDRYMAKQATQYPHYGFENHVGYGTRQHLEMISKHGPCELHRRNFAPFRTETEPTPGSVQGALF
jgi:ribonuclease HII